MAPTPLSTTSRYISPEVTKIYWVATVATLASPTRSELDAGTDLTAEVAAATGWEITADRVAVPDLGTKFVGRISGRVNPGDAQIVFYASEDTEDVRDVLARGDQGNIFIGDGGDVTGQKARMFAVEVSAVTPTVDVAGTEGARIMVDFSITAVAEEVIVPS
jgi:hypothetical protein